MFYSNKKVDTELRLPHGHARLGQYCVALFAKIWHRALIIDCDHAGFVNVFHIDYGTVETVHEEKLRYLHKQFSELPGQAIKVCEEQIGSITIIQKCIF